MVPLEWPCNRDRPDRVKKEMNKQSIFPESLKGLLKGLEILRMFDEKYRKKD